MGDQYAPGEFTIFCDDQYGKWKYAGFTSKDSNLVAKVNSKATSPTTSTYAGLVSMNPAIAKHKPVDYRVAMITFKFVNDQLKKSLELNFPVDIVVRRKVMTDPPRVAFGRDVKDQKRSVLVQSLDHLSIDAAMCDSPSVKALLHRVDAKTLIVEMAYIPQAIQSEGQQSLVCHLMSEGKVIESIPITIVDVH